MIRLVSCQMVNTPESVSTRRQIAQVIELPKRPKNHR